MRYMTITGVILAAGVIAAGCASLPETEELNQAEILYRQAESEPDVAEYAPVPLHEAEQALERARNAEDTADQRHHAFMAKRKVELARTEAEREAARRQAGELEQQQKDFLLEMNRQRAEQARQEAKQAQEELRTYQTREERQQLEQAREEAQRAQAELERLKSEMSELQAKETEEGVVLTLSDVIFEFNKAELKAGAERSLQRLSTFLQQNPERKVLIEGFTDSVGSDSYNQELSRRRAEAVAQALEIEGIAPDRITTRGMGEDYPVASNETAAGRQQNRRVEITILKPGGRTSGGGGRSTM